MKANKWLKMRPTMGFKRAWVFKLYHKGQTIVPTEGRKESQLYAEMGLGLDTTSKAKQKMGQLWAKMKANCGMK